MDEAVAHTAHQRTAPHQQQQHVRAVGQLHCEAAHAANAKQSGAFFPPKKSRLAGLRDGRGRVKATLGWKRRCPQCLFVKSILTASRTVGGMAPRYKLAGNGFGWQHAAQHASQHIYIHSTSQRSAAQAAGRLLCAVVCKSDGAISCQQPAASSQREAPTVRRPASARLVDGRRKKNAIHAHARANGDRRRGRARATRAAPAFLLSFRRPRAALSFFYDLTSTLVLARQTISLSPSALGLLF